MANIQWTPQSFQQVRFDPNASLATASKAFQNIGDQIAAEEAAAATADYRGQVLDQARSKQLFAEQAPQRAEDLRKATLARSAEQGLLAEGIAAEAGGSRLDETMLSPEVQSDPRFQELTGVQGVDGGAGVGPMMPENQAAVDNFRSQALAQNKRLFSDPTTYSNTVRTKLLASGKFTREEADTIAKEKTTQLFPTLDKDVALKIYGKGGVGGTTGKAQFDIGSPKGRSDMVDTMVARHDLDARPDNVLWTDMRYDINRNDPTGSDMSRITARLASDGVVSSTSAEAAIEQAFSQDGKTLLDDYNFLKSEEGYQKVKDLALSTQAQETARVGGQQNAGMEGLLSSLNPDRSTRGERISTILSGLPTNPTKADVKKVKKEAKKAGVPAKVVEAAVQVKKIMPPGTSVQDASLADLAVGFSQRFGEGVISGGKKAAKGLFDVLTTEIPYAE